MWKKGNTHTRHENAAIFPIQYIVDVFSLCNRHPLLFYNVNKAFVCDLLHKLWYNLHLVWLRAEQIWLWHILFYLIELEVALLCGRIRSTFDSIHNTYIVFIRLCCFSRLFFFFANDNSRLDECFPNYLYLFTVAACVLAWIWLIRFELSTRFNTDN